MATTRKRAKSTVARPVSARVSSDRLHAAWLVDAPVVAGGWEPPLYLRRDKGGDAWEWEEPCREQHSPAAFRAMADEGVTTFITYYHKGMGGEVTADERADVKRQVAELHRLGMRAGVYFRIDNVFPETFFLEIPAARNWLLKTENGTTPNVTGRPYRKRVCRNHPGYRRYAAKVLRHAVRAIGADIVHLDGFHGYGERETCHCPHCQRKFQAFLQKRWSGRPEAARRRFGFPRLDGVAIPELGSGNRREATAERIIDPILQEYIRFRCEDWAEFHRFVMSVVAAAGGDDVEVVLNCGVFSYQNTVAGMGLYLPLIDPRRTMIFIEDPHYPRFCDGNLLCHRIRDYKTAAALGLPCIAYCSAQSGDAASDAAFQDLASAESMAFNGGMVGHVKTAGDVNSSGPTPEESIRRAALFAWRRRNRDLWDGARSACEIGVLRDCASMAFDCFPPWRETMLVEETLIRRQIPFDLVFDETLAKAVDDGLKVLVLAGQSCLSDALVERIAGFVAAGGRLLITGAAGSRTEDAIRRRQNALIRALGLAASGGAGADEPSAGTAGEAIPANFDMATSDSAARTGLGDVWPVEPTLFTGVLGKGEVAYIPGVVPAVEKENWHPTWRAAAKGGYEVSGEIADPDRWGIKQYPYCNWRLPKNAGQITDAIRRLHAAPFIVDAPDTVAIEWRRLAAPGAEAVHFVNYDNTYTVEGASVFLREGRYARAEFRRLDPAPNAEQAVAIGSDGRLRLPPFRTYGVLLLFKK